MAARKPKAGGRYVATAGPLVGTTVTVVEVVPPDVPGAAAFLPDAPLEDFRAAREADREELAELVAAGRYLPDPEATDDPDEQEAARLARAEHEEELAELRARQGRAAHDREAPWQDAAVLVEWEEPAMVADTSAEPRLVEQRDVDGQPVRRPSGQVVTSPVWPMVAGTRRRRWSASLSTFRDQFEEA